MDNREVKITVCVEHPDVPDGMYAELTVPAGQFGPEPMRHMCEGLYGKIKEQARRKMPAIIVPRKGLVQ